MRLYGAAHVSKRFLDFCHGVRARALAEILSIYFTLILGIPPPWTILALGLLVSGAAFARQALRLGAAGFDAGKIG